MIIVIIITIIAFILYATFAKKSKRQTFLNKHSSNTSTFKEKEKKNPIEISVTYTTTSVSKKAELFPPVKALGNDCFILNPSAPFELTLQNSTSEISNKIRNILDREDTYDNNKEEELVALFAEHNLKIKEIEEYKEKYGKIYKTRIDELKRTSEEWKVASDLDKKDILEGFRQLALKEIYEKANCDLVTLFENEPKDITIDDELIKEYGFKNIEFYLRFANDLDKVKIIPHDNNNRKMFENLVELGLAVRGKEIPKELILQTLTLKDLNDIASNSDKQFKRKNQAIEYILQLPNLEEKLEKKISYRELFKINPLPIKYSHINLTELSDTWNYIYEVVYLLIITYRHSYYSYQTLKMSSGEVKGYNVYCYDSEENMCPCAKELINKTYHSSNVPKIPYHIGCTCSLQPVYKF